MVSTFQGSQMNPSQNVGATASFRNAVGVFDNGTEDIAEISYQSAGTLSLLTFYVGTNSNTANRVCVLRVNNATVNQSVTVTATTTGIFQDTVDTDAIVADDDIAISIPTGGSGSMDSSVTLVFAATSNTVSKWAANTDVNFTAASTTYRCGIFGFLDNNQTSSDTDVVVKPKTAGTWKNFSVLVDSNARTTTSTGRTRVNAANGNQSVSITSSSTGLFEDTTNTDELVADDEICYAMVLGTGTGTLGVNHEHSEFETTDSIGVIPSINTTATDLSVNAGVTNYYCLYGYPEPDATETDEVIQLEVDRNRVFSDMSINVAANSLTASTTIRTRINQTNGSQSVSVPSSTTGFFDETVDTDEVTTDDIINFQIIAGGTGTSIAVSGTSITTNEPAVEGGADDTVGRFFGTISYEDVIMGITPLDLRARPIFE